MNITDQEIAKLKSDYLGLTINGIEDKVGFKKVYEARQDVKRTRVALTKYAKGLREDAQEWQRKVIAEEKRVVGELEEIESHLQAEEDKIEAEKERIKKEAEAKEAKRIQDRIDALATYGFAIDFTTIKSIDDETFQGVLENAKAEHAKEQERKAEEERRRLEEEARLKAEREELERLRAEQAKAQAIIDAENERIRLEQARIDNEKKAAELERQRIEQEKQRAQELEKAREEAAEKARLKAIEDARIARENEIREAEEKKRAEARELALRPDKEKLQAFATKIGSVIDFDVTDEKAQVIVNDISVMIGKMQKHILTKIKEL